MRHGCGKDIHIQRHQRGHQQQKPPPISQGRQRPLAVLCASDNGDSLRYFGGDGAESTVSPVRSYVGPGLAPMTNSMMRDMASCASTPRYHGKRATPLHTAAAPCSQRLISLKTHHHKIHLVTMGRVHPSTQVLTATSIGASVLCTTTDTHSPTSVSIPVAHVAHTSDTDTQ